MAGNEPTGPKSPEGGDRKSFADAVTDYLAAARKKRRTFVIMAMGEIFDEELAGGIEGFVKNNYPNHSIALPKNEQELRRMFNRNIVLMIVDDEFMDMEGLLKVVLDMKQRKQEAVVPVLFLTRHPERLVEEYRKVLVAYHESDEYIAYKGMATPLIMAKIKNALEHGNRRRSRRYKTDIDVTFESLSRKGAHKGLLVDLSVHGALLRADGLEGFHVGEQLALFIPTGDALRKEVGEFIRLAGRVRRVFINGGEVGLSFDHLSERQLFLLTKFLVHMVSHQVAHQTAMTAIRKPAKS